MWEILKFEIKYRLKRPETYIYFVILFLMAFGAITTDVIQVGGGAGQVKENAPTTISFFQIILSVIPGLILASSVMGLPILRDFTNNTASMMFTAPITKTQYLGGRFLGSLTMNVLIFSGIFFGMALGYLMPWIDQENLLPYNLAYLVKPFLVFILPNIFIMSCLFFASGALSRNILVVYIQGIFLFIFYAITSELMESWDNQNLGALLDPFAINTNSHVIRYWTVAEQNSNSVGFTGLVLWNRLLWMGIALASLLFTFWKFDFNLISGKGKKNKKTTETKELPNVISAAIDIPKVRQFSGIGTSIKQIINLAGFYFKWLANQYTFLALVIGGILFTAAGFFFGLGGMYDVNVYPSTYRVLGLLGDFNIFFFIITVLYSGELVWKERDVKINLIYDAMPYPNYVSLIGKFLALVLIFIVLLFTLGLVGIAAQSLMGFTHYEIPVYIKSLFVDDLSNWVLFAFLGFFMHTIINHKFIGHSAMVVFFIATLMIDNLGWEHNMLQFASGSLGQYSDMNGFGHYFQPFTWFSSYWLGFALVLFTLVLLFTVRGANTAIKTRFKLSAQRWNKSIAELALVSILLFAGAGYYIYYNTNILNKYQNSDDGNADQAEYETTLKKYENQPLLKIVDTYVEVDVYPETRSFTAKGNYTLKNKTEKPIDKLYVQFRTEKEIQSEVTFSVPVKIEEQWDKFKFFIYKLAAPLPPGDSIKMDFVTNYNSIGFVESGSNTEILHNGTFFNNTYFPTFGYQTAIELGSDDDRKDNDLPKKERMRPREDAQAVRENLLGATADRIRFEIIMSTSPKQIAIAPGYLQKEWEDDGRRYFHYKMDVPILNFYSMVSAEYEVVRNTWTNGKQDVNLEIYYHHGHDYNLDKMLKGMKMSLDYYTTHFSAYQYRQLRIMEFPRYRSFAQSFSNTVPFSEDIGFMLDVGEDDVDIPFYVTAHEIAHQWWAHQVTEADVQGNAMSSETMSQYSALMVMKKEFKPEIIQKFLELELDRYLRGRSSETKKEQPLDHVEGQGYIHYRKGSLVMYALQDYISEDSVNVALRRIIDKWAYKEDRYITSDIYLDEFRKVTPDSLQYIISDLFEKITLFENRTKEASYQEKDGQYLVTLSASSIKYQADSLGNETKVPINDWVDIGIYTEDQEGKDKLIYLQKHKIDKEDMTFQIRVNEKPITAGIDPLNILIDRNPKDNRKRVNLKETEEE
ncbi:MAG: M1 family aminopeptidase [Saprospiraceae bacterium]